MWHRKLILTTCSLPSNCHFSKWYHDMRQVCMGIAQYSTDIQLNIHLLLSMCWGMLMYFNQHFYWRERIFMGFTYWSMLMCSLNHWWWTGELVLAKRNHHHRYHHVFFLFLIHSYFSTLYWKSAPNFNLFNTIREYTVHICFISMTNQPMIWWGWNLQWVQTSLPGKNV